MYSMTLDSACHNLVLASGPRKIFIDGLTKVLLLAL